METASTSTSGSVHPAHALPDELWALVLSKVTWRGAWSVVKPLLLWRPGAGRALQASPPLLAHLLSSHGSHSALSISAARDRADVAALLLQQCEDGGAAVADALVAAASRGHIAVLQLLLGHGTCDLSDALILAVSSGHSRAAELLLDKGVVDERTRTNSFSLAAGHGHTEIMRLLLQRGINRPRALDASVLDGDAVAAAMLLDAGVSLDGDNSLCMVIAAKRGHEDLVHLLLEHGAAADDDFLLSSAVSYAAVQGRRGCVEVLLRHGAALPAEYMEVTVRNSAAAGHADIAELLFFHGRVRTRGAERQLAALLGDGG